METVNEALSLSRRQAELKQSMKEAGGIRITEEQVGGLTSGSLPGLPLSPTAGGQKANCDGGNLLSRRACKDPRTHESRDLRLYRDRAAHLVARLKPNGAAEVRGPRLSSRLGDLRGSADTPTCSLIYQRVAWACREPQFWRLPWHPRRACVGSAPPRTTKY